MSLNQQSSCYRYPQAYRQIIHHAGPIAGVTAVSTVSDFLITIILASNGITALAALSFLLLFGELSFVCVGEFPLVASSAEGLAGESQVGILRSRRMIFNTALLTVLVIAALTVTSLWTTPFLRLIGQSHDVSDMTGNFLPFYLVAIGLRLLSRMIEDLYIMHEKSHQALIISIIDRVGLCLLTYTMSKHHLFADTTGLSGFVYSSLLCNCLTLIVLYFHSRYYHRFQELIDFFNQKLSKADLIEVLRLGGPMVFQQMIEMGAIVSSSLMLGMINVKALVARHIANQYTMNLAVPVFGFADASSLLVSQQIGRGRMINAYKLTMATMSLATMIPLFLLGVTYTLNPDSLMLLFKTKNMNAHIGHSVLTFMRIQLVVLVLDGMCYPLVSVLRSYRDTFVPCLWSFLSLALMGPAFGYVMGVKQQIPEWVLWGEAVGVFVGLAYLLPRWRRTSIRHLQPTSIKIEHLKAARFACLCGSMVYPERAYADPRQTPQQQNGHDARFEQQGLLSDVDA